MSLEDLYARDIEANYRRAVSANRPPPETSFSLWSAAKAGAGGVPGALLEVAGSGADALGVAERQVQSRPRPRVLQGQPALRPEAAASGEPFRSKAAEFAPDPQTAHVADQVVYGLTRFGTKAVAAVVAAGPVAGSALLGAEETNTQYRALLDKGVDSDAALLTAATIGGASAVGAVLPVSATALPTMAGKIAGTTALVGLGGPGLYAAQEGIANQILSTAGYDQEAATHDPTDPLGLALSTIIPGGFGAWSLRNAVRQQRAALKFQTEAQALEAAKLSPEEQAASDAFERSEANLAQLRAAIASEKSPENRAILEAELAKQEAAAVAAAREPAQPADLETMDAARVVQVERALTRDLPDMPNARALVLEAMDEVAAGRFPEMPAARFQAVDSAAVLRAADEPFPWDVEDAPLPPPVDARAAADELRAMALGAEWAQRGGGIIRSGIDEAGDQGLGGSVVGRTPWGPAQEWYARMRSSLGDGGLSDRADIEIAVEKAIRGKRLTAREQRTIDWMRAEVADVRAQLRRMDFTPDEADVLSADGMSAGLSRADAADLALTSRAAQLDEAAVERAAIQFADDDAGFMSEIRRILDEDATANAGRDRAQVRAEAESAVPRDDAIPDAPAEPAPKPVGKPRDLKAELIQARKAESLLRSLLECLG